MLEELESSFTMRGGQGCEPARDFKQEHQPVELARIPVFADDAGQMQVRGIQFDSELLAGFPARACIRRFTVLCVELPPAGAPQTAIWLLRPLHQQHLIAVAEAIEHRGNFVRQHTRPSLGPAPNIRQRRKCLISLLFRDDSDSGLSLGLRKPVRSIAFPGSTMIRSNMKFKFLGIGLAICFLAAPDRSSAQTISGFTPLLGSVSDQVEIDGSGFAPGNRAPTNLVVTFNGTRDTSAPVTADNII